MLPRDVCLLRKTCASDKIRPRRFAERDHEEFSELVSLLYGFAREAREDSSDQNIEKRTREIDSGKQRNGIRAISLAKFRGPLDSNGEVNT